jgi:hypothetical protein
MLVLGKDGIEEGWVREEKKKYCYIKKCHCLTINKNISYIIIVLLFLEGEEKGKSAFSLYISYK